MDCQELIPKAFDLSTYRFGRPQRSGTMTVLPIFGVSREDESTWFVPPRSGLKLSTIRGYGNMELLNSSANGIAIVPLHMGYIQDKAQNHALCRSAFIGTRQKLMFTDACCVQQAQGGYMEGREQWFFVLPLQLREEALNLRGVDDYSKLWEAISGLNVQFGLPDRGHLEQIVTKKRAFLTQYQTRLELLPEQTGALFFIKNKLAGIEIAPSPEFFQEIWMPLVCFCYGTTAMYEESQSTGHNADKLVIPFVAENLSQIREQLNKSRLDLQEQIRNSLSQIPAESFTKHEEERFLSMTLYTVNGNNFAGQYVEDQGRLVYASLFARPKFLN